MNECIKSGYLFECRKNEYQSYRTMQHFQERSLDKAHMKFKTVLMVLRKIFSPLCVASKVPEAG